MNKLRFFIKLNRQDKWKCLMLFLVFAFAGTVIAGTLFVSQNNDVFYQAQFAGTQYRAEDFGGLGYQQAENILNIFSLAGIMAAVWGSVIRMVFKELSMEKTSALCKIYGMKEWDLLYKASADLFLYGITGGMAGALGGYQLFRYLAAHVCKVEAVIRFFSPDTLGVAGKELLILCTIAFFGSLAAGSFVYRRPVMHILYQRQGRREKSAFAGIAAAGGLILAAETLLVFRASLRYILIIVSVAAVTAVLLYTVFHFIFAKRLKGHRNSSILKSVWGLSFRFLCSRSRKDAVLAAAISVGAVLICFIMNLRFNFSGIITDSYRDNMGYSVGVRVDEWNDVEQIGHLPDENGYQYTLLYSKLMPYKELYGREDTEGEFWAAVIGAQTDGNSHFFVPEGSFAAEGYFSGHLNIEAGDTSEIFGRKMSCDRILTEVQALSLISYNILIWEQDWNYGLDASWSPIFLLDLSKSQIKELRQLLGGMPCEVQTASMIADALQEIFAAYISVVMLIGGMLVIVTATFFYSMIQNDLSTRRTEMFLYQTFGASEKKSRLVIYQEYMMIALIASFGVVAVIMLFGEAFFLFFLHRHYPVSVPVVLATTVAAGGFIMLCCVAAGRLDAGGRQVELIRDE